MTWSSGRVAQRDDGVIGAPDFSVALASFCQATPKKKFLNWLVANNYETNLTVA